MTSIIKRIQDDIIAKDFKVSQEYRDLCREVDKAWDKLRPDISEAMIEELQNRQCDVEYQANLDWFREGIRVGMSLMLELL